MRAYVRVGVQQNEFSTSKLNGTSRLEPLHSLVGMLSGDNSYPRRESNYTDYSNPALTVL